MEGVQRLYSASERVELQKVKKKKSKAVQVDKSAYGSEWMYEDMSVRVRVAFIATDPQGPNESLCQAK